MGLLVKHTIVNFFPLAYHEIKSNNVNVPSVFFVLIKWVKLERLADSGDELLMLAATLRN
jgi:hypothetical protein